MGARRSSVRGVETLLFGRDRELEQLRVFIDPDLLQYDEVWAAAGTWHDVFALSPTDLERVSGGVVTDLRRA